MATSSPSFSSRSSGSSGSSGELSSLHNPAKLATNVYPISNDHRTIHRYSVSIDKKIIRNNKEDLVQLSRAGGADAIRIPRERVNGGIIQYLSRQWNDVFFLYEGSAILFTNMSIPGINGKEIYLDDLASLVSDADYNIFLKGAVSVIVTITPDERMVDITEMVNKSTEENVMIADFLAALARKHAPEQRFVAYRGGKLIDNMNVKDINFGHKRAPGISMGVGAVRNESTGAPMMALNIDVTEATLYKEQHLINAICQYFGGTYEQLRNCYGNRSTMQDIERYIRDIVVRCEHTNKVFTVCGLKWDKNGNLEPWTSAVCKDEAYVQKYPDSAVAVEMIRGKFGLVERHFPLNALWVMPGTRVQKEKQKGPKPRPMNPQQRYDAMQKGRKDIHIDQQNEALYSFGTNISPDPIFVNQRRLDAPKMLASSGTMLREMRIDATKHNWRSDEFKYVKGANVNEMYYVYQTNGSITEAQANEFAIAHNACCKAKGMKIGSWAGRGVAHLGELEETIVRFEDYRKKMRAEGQEDYRIFLILLGEKNVEWHDRLKLLEQRHAVQTQHVFADTIKKILKDKKTKDFTMLNIAMKTNLKAGGENFKIGDIVGGNSLFPSDTQLTLIIGLDVAHPPPQTRQQKMRGVPVDPSCIGISSNCMTTNLQSFTGYEVYTEARREAATAPIMNKEGHHLMQKFIENQKGRLPTNVVYFRDGVDKGQYQNVKDEFDWMMEGMREHLNTIGRGDEFAPRELIVLATKRHNIRAYEQTRTGVANVKAGTVIDCGIVSPFYPEFYLYASHALIGTAKGVQCTVLRDSTEKEQGRYPDGKLKDVEKFVHALAFGHQICDSPTSLPEPLYNAHETAKRGSANYKAYRNSTELRETITTDELTKKLSNRDTELGRVKFNA